jgi:uncharacterized phage protein gp47/JayE
VAIDNRPGLSAVAYRIGTFGSFRETMLDAVAGTPELANLTTRQSDDDAITFIDLWAALLDVVTFYQERYANEVFLRTAQQPESLRRLARLLDYRPRPGVAALAVFAFTLEAGKTTQIPVGLRVQSVPAQNQQPQTFETLQAIEADARFNRLRIFPKPTPVNPLRQGSSEAILDRLAGPSFLAALTPNDPVILFNAGSFDPPEEKKVAALTVRDDMVALSWTRPIVGNRWNADTKAFKHRRTFRLFGYNAPTSFTQPKTKVIAQGEIPWTLLQTDFSNPAGAVLVLDSRYSDLASGGQLLIVMPGPPVAPPPPPPVIDPGIFGNGGVLTTLERIDPGRFQGGGRGSLGVRTLLATITQVDQVAATTPIHGIPRGTVPGAMSDAVTQLTLDISLPPISDIRNIRVHELIGDQIRFWGYEYDASMATPTAYLPGRFVETPDGMGIEVGRTIQQNSFAPGSVIRPQDIDVGRSVILADGQGQNVQGSVQGPPLSDPPNPAANAFGHLVIPLQVDALALATGSAVLLGNVARASQGQTVMNEIVGSGDASAKFQSFTLQRQPLTYVPSSAPGGVSSTLRLFVNQLQWTEVPELFSQPPTAQVFSTRTTDDGKTLIQVGGSTFGAALPTGNANVTATYRVGGGVAGRVDAGALTTLLDRLQGLTSVTNPLPAEGGADPETRETIRRNAPRTVRTFDRAVSLQDFQDLVTESGEVAKARATWVWDGFAPAVHLTVAGADGGTFSDLTSLAATLAEARDPNHRLLIDNCTKVPIRLEAKVWVDPARSQTEVVAAATDAMLKALAFDELELGEALHLSLIYSVLQNVPGVIAADVTRFGFKNTSISFLQSRGATFLPNGSVAPVQDFLRIFAARPNPGHPGQVVPAELASIETLSQDVLITMQGS